MNDTAIRQAIRRVNRFAPRLADEKLGYPMRVKTGRGRYVRGTIDRCEYAGHRIRGRDVVAQFRVWLLARTGNVNGPYTVEKLPR